MKSKVNFDKTAPVNFHTEQLLIYDDNNELLIVLSNGESHGDTFQGTVVFAKGIEHKIGFFSDSWTKHGVKLYNGSVTLEN